ncbi:MAG: hypothetical protein ABIE84_07350 [bacterium]
MNEHLIEREITTLFKGRFDRAIDKHLDGRLKAYSNAFRSSGIDLLLIDMFGVLLTTALTTDYSLPAERINDCRLLASQLGINLTEIIQMVEKMRFDDTQAYFDCLAELFFKATGVYTLTGDDGILLIPGREDLPQAIAKINEKTTQTHQLLQFWTRGPVITARTIL